MTDMRERIRRMMRRLRQTSGLPPSAQIVGETFQRLGYTDESLSRDDVLSNFNWYLKILFDETLPTLESYEERAYSQGIPKGLLEEYPDLAKNAENIAADRGFQAGVLQLFQEWYPMLRRAFQSVDQSRRTRGGKDFELQIEGLLSLAEIPFTRQDAKSRTDLILPSSATFQYDRTVSLVVSVKRTLRERWREVVEELSNLQAPNIYLFTADSNVADSVVNRVCRQLHIHLVVWDEIKDGQYPNEPLVYGYTQWADQRLQFLMREWDQRDSIPFNL